MSNFGSQSVDNLLRDQQDLLIEIAGTGGFEIESFGADRAVFRTEALEVCFGREWDGDLSGSGVALRNPPKGAIADAESSLWAKFLDIDIEPAARDARGWVLTKADEQIRNELELILRLVHEIFSEPEVLRNATYFIAGYEKAYNDWAKGEL